MDGATISHAGKAGAAPIVIISSGPDVVLMPGESTTLRSKP
jgi:hypothetical protein